MPKPLSNAMRASLTAHTGKSPLFFLEINHVDLVQPVRLVNDSMNWDSNGDTYAGIPFDIDIPNDSDRNRPEVALRAGNAGRELVNWLEISRGGRGAQATFKLARREDPDTIEWQYTMHLSNVTVTYKEVSGRLTFDEIINKPLIVPSHSVEFSPGLY